MAQFSFFPFYPFHKPELLLHRYPSTSSLMLMKLMFPNRYFWEAEYMMIRTISYYWVFTSEAIVCDPIRFLLFLPDGQSAKGSTPAQEMMLSELSGQHFSSKNTFKGWPEPIWFYWDSHNCTFLWWLPIISLFLTKVLSSKWEPIQQTIWIW